jgi:hypothetical protein
MEIGAQSPSLEATDHAQELALRGGAAEGREDRKREGGRLTQRDGNLRARRKKVPDSRQTLERMRSAVGEF